MIGVYIFTIIAFVVSIVLVGVDKTLNKKSRKELEILNILPNYNCGACGYKTCTGMVSAILEDKNNVLKCKPLKEKEQILEKLRKIV